MNCGELQKSEGQQQADMMAMQQQQQTQSVVTTQGCVVNQAPQMQSFQTLQLQQPPQSSTPLPSASPVAMQMMPPQQPQMHQQFATEWQGQRIQLVPQQQGPMYVQQVYNAQNGQQFLIPANNVIHHPGQPLQVITTGKPTFQPGPMTPQLISTPQGKATMVQAGPQGGTTQCYIPAQQASGNPNQTLLISHLAQGQQGATVMPSPNPNNKQADPQKAKVLQAQQKTIQQQSNMIVQQQPQQIITQAGGVIPNQQIIQSPMQWQSFPNQQTMWAQHAGGMPMNTGAINTTSSPIFIRSTQPDGTHVYIQSNPVQQQMQQAQMATQAQVPQQQQQQPQIKPAVTKPETINLSTNPPNIQPKVITQQKTLTIRPSGVQQPIQPASTVSTQTSVAVSASKAAAKVKIKAGRPLGKAITPDGLQNKQQQLPQQITMQQQVQQQMNNAGQQIIVNKVLLPNNQPMQVVCSADGTKMTTTQPQTMMTKLVPMTQQIQFIPQTLSMQQQQQLPPKDKPMQTAPVMAPVVPLQPVAPAPILQIDQTKTPSPVQTEENNKEDENMAVSLDTADEEEEEGIADERGREKLKATVKPQVLTHVIEGFVIQEAGEPFPTTTSTETATCEFCKKTDLRSKFKKSKRFCSSSCAKSHKRQKEDKVGGKKARSAASESSGEELVIDETTTSSANAESSPSPTAPNINPQEWTVKEVCDFIQVLPGCAEYVEDFSMQEIDGQALMLLRADHLMSAMGMKLGPALKICAKIQQLKNGIVDTT